MNRVEILNCYYDKMTFQEVLDWSIQSIKDGHKGYIATVNVAISMALNSNSTLKQFINKASLVVADGQPIVWASKLFSSSLPERVTGIDLVEGLAKVAEQENFRVFLLGSKPEVIQTVAEKLQTQYPGLEICGYDHGYFKKEEVPQVVEKIKNSQAQILIVGMGVPLQEDFIQENLSALNVNLAIGVGGSFEVIAGKKKRAPLWMQKYGLEWVYRLLQEPGRLWKRYLVSNAQFLFYLVLEVLKQNWKITKFSRI